MNGVGRRAFLSATAGLAVAAALPGTSSAAPAAGRRNARAFLVAAMDAQPDPVRLVQSYADQASLFSTAYSTATAA